MNKTLIVGGNITTGRQSSVVNQLSAALSLFSSTVTYNGELLASMDGSNGAERASVQGYDLVIWMPEVDNSMKKVYPLKSKGSVLICSKFMRKGYTKATAMERIFRMQANAIIIIRKHKSGQFIFELVDALGNTWIETSDITYLANNIQALKVWTKESVRISYKHRPGQYVQPFIVEKVKTNLASLIDINNIMASKVQKNTGERFFGNLSTRCSKLFPTYVIGDMFFVSPRNSDKEKLTAEDFVAVNSFFQYYGDKKPSVDTPVQVAIYQNFPNVRYMIHGHAFINGAPSTRNYYPCGDMREVLEIFRLFHRSQYTINLMSHGFLIAGTSLVDLAEKVEKSELLVPYS